MTLRAAWIGLGVMGFPMAGHLATRGGLDMTVYNRTAAKAAQLDRAAIAGEVGANPGGGGQGCRFRLCLRRQ